MLRRLAYPAAVLLVLAVSACGQPGGSRVPPAGPTATTAPRFAHIVVVVEENHDDDQIIGNPDAPYLNTLARQGVQLTSIFAITHPSQPNYLALFSGSTQHVTSDHCPVNSTGPNLASALIAAGDTFTGYSEDLPRPGYTGCSSAGYARKHNPWTDFAGLPGSLNQPFSAFPTDYGQLPTVAFVVPNLDDDMHNGTVAGADGWLATHLAGYARWARSHDSLLIITWDEDDGDARNQIPTILYGSGLLPGADRRHATLYTLLRTIEDIDHLPHLGHTRTAAPLTGI